MAARRRPARGRFVAVSAVMGVLLGGAPTAATPGPAETTVTVVDEAGYRAALAALSADSSGPHRIELGADIVVDDGTDPTYTGARALTIDGNGFTLDGAGANRLLVHSPGTTARLRLLDLTMTGGRTTGDGGAVLVQGGAAVEIGDAAFTDNIADGSGGAVAADEVATVARSRFQRNTAMTGDGGALDAAVPTGQFTISGSLFGRNRAPAGEGGAVSGMGGLSSVASIRRSTFLRNSALRGGAVVLSDYGDAINSTFVANRATDRGGGLLIVSATRVYGIYLTITGNAAPVGANLAYAGTDLVLHFSVLAEPGGGGANCALEGARNLQENLSDDRSCGRRTAHGPARLGPLGDHGGRTPTRVPLAGSPLIDAIAADFGYPALLEGCARFLGTGPGDQRGVVRPRDGDGRSRPDSIRGQDVLVAADCDIGAVEARAVRSASRTASGTTGVVAGRPTFTD